MSFKAFEPTSTKLFSLLGLAYKLYLAMHELRPPFFFSFRLCEVELTDVSSAEKFSHLGLEALLSRLRIYRAELRKILRVAGKN